jgi:hypothetical protein
MLDPREDEDLENSEYDGFSLPEIIEYNDNEYDY